MSISDTLRVLAGIFMVLAFVATCVVRFTPVPWFPWDLIVTGVLFVLAFALSGASQRVGIENPPSPKAQPLPVLFSWILGAFAIAMVVTHLLPYEHSLSSIIFFGIVAVGVVGGVRHRNAIRRRTSQGGVENAV